MHSDYHDNFDTEHRIECAVSRKIDRLDDRFMRGEYTQAEYDDEIRAIDDWAQQQYSASRRYWRR